MNVSTEKITIAGLFCGKNRRTSHEQESNAYLTVEYFCSQLLAHRQDIQSSVEGTGGYFAVDAMQIRTLMLSFHKLLTGDQCNAKRFVTKLIRLFLMLFSTHYYGFILCI